MLLDSWGAIDADVHSKPSASNEFVPSEPASVRIEKVLEFTCFNSSCFTGTNKQRVRA